MPNELPNVNLFNVEGVVDLYDEVLMFLESGAFLQGCSNDQRKRLALHSRKFMVILG